MITRGFGYNTGRNLEELYYQMIVKSQGGGWQSREAPGISHPKFYMKHKCPYIVGDGSSA